MLAVRPVGTERGTDGGVALRRKRLAECAVAGVLFSIAAYFTLRFGWFFATIDGHVHFDGGYAAAFAERLLDGRFLPYVDAYSHRGPLLYWSAAIAQLFGGRYEWAGVRGLILFTHLATVFACLGVGLAARRPLAGAIAAAVYTYLTACVLELESAFGLLGEVIAAPFGVVSLVLAATAILRVEKRWTTLALLASSGSMSAFAALAKQSFLPLGWLILPWILTWALTTGDRTRKERLLAPLAFVIGWATPLLVTVGAYAIAGELSAFWYWFFTYNAEVYMSPYPSAQVPKAIHRWFRDHPVVGLACVALVATGTARVLRGVARRGWRGWGHLAASYAKVGLDATIILVATLMFAAALAPLRFFAHYFVPFAPWFGLLFAVNLDASIRRYGSPLVSGTIATFLGAFLASMAWSQLDGQEGLRSRGKKWTGAYPEPICAITEGYSRPDERIFVWGFDSDLYITCKRKPASGYLYSTLVAGVVPPFWRDERPERRARGARETVLAEFAEHPPAVILDSPSRVRGYSIEAVPELRRYLRDGYCKLPNVRAKGGREITPWVRNDRCPEDRPKRRRRR